MTEKRFEICRFNPTVAPLKIAKFVMDKEGEYKDIHTIEGCVVIMNDLNKENEELREINMRLNKLLLKSVPMESLE